MTLIKLQDALIGVYRLGLDTDAIVYFVQANPDYAALVSEVFRQAAVGQLIGFTSTVSLTETLIQPIRTGDMAVARKFRDLLLRSANLDSIPVNAETAADLRVRYNLRTPDAPQVATAIQARCEAFLTNNGKHFRRVAELRVLVLDEMEL